MPTRLVPTEVLKVCRDSTWGWVGVGTWAPWKPGVHYTFGTSCSQRSCILRTPATFPRLHCRYQYFSGFALLPTRQTYARHCLRWCSQNWWSSSTEKGTIYWKWYHLRERVPSTGEGTIYWRGYHLLERVPSTGKGTIYWKGYHLRERVPSTGEGTIYWRGYHLRERVPSTGKGTIYGKGYHLRERVQKLIVNLIK